MRVKHPRMMHVVSVMSGLPVTGLPMMLLLMVPSAATPAVMTAAAPAVMPSASA
jgi:hypothetical protein